MLRRALFARNDALFPSHEATAWPTERNNPPAEPPPGEFEALGEAPKGFVLSRQQAAQAARNPWGRQNMPEVQFRTMHMHVDDRKGRLALARRPGCESSSRNVALSLPLQEVTGINLMQMGDGGHCLEVTSPGMRVALRADALECERWMDSLEPRVKWWRRRAELAGPKRCVPLFGRDAQREGSCWHLPQGGSRPAW